MFAEPVSRDIGLADAQLEPASMRIKPIRLKSRVRFMKKTLLAMRRARVRQHFIDNLQESRLVLDTKSDGFLAMTHLWAGEAVYQ